ncbi:hypothetical protein EJA72_24670 [Pseudomonas sp. PB120]|uniref:hypothetical protein n=1 Tax=Pseudomonas sp. PB120 TaxID=2494700 RepID=UPI0012FD7A39|nr:hypothetical protein [Pseudomonas sp. PB120]MVV51409.1 hypothetical protein [Pseudomonas sp. PB120]
MPALVDAVVVGGCLLSFADTVQAQDRQDIQDCLLYAELAANDKYPGLVSNKMWFDYYQGRLLKAGFTLTAIIPTEPIRVSTVHQLLDISYSTIGRVGSKRMAQLVTQTYRALKLDAFAWDFFQGNIARGGAGILKCAPCERLGSGETVVCLYGLRYRTHVSGQAFFWDEFYKEVVIMPDGGVFAFNRDVFERYRERVHEKIDAYSSKIFVRKLTL